MEHEGFTVKEFTDVADVYVINTCSVTDNADKECRQLVRRIQRKAPESMVVVTGCYAQLKPEEIASIEGVDLVLGAAEKFNITKHLDELVKGDKAKICSCDIEDVSDFNTSFSLTGRTRTFLKVQDGCDYNCSFCTIPMARGKSRSNTIARVLVDVEHIAAQGVKEIVLTGINLGDFGKNELSDGKGLKRAETFFTLLQELEETSIERYRISSIEPNLLSDDIIQLVSQSSKIMPHFHIPLQSGSNRILGMMKRRYRRELYSDKIAMIKQLMPHCGIGVDVIVGFPGESDADFKETADFLTGLDVSYLHVFTYSERANTEALNIKPVVPVHIRNERNKVLRNLSYTKSRHFENLHSGQTRKVLFESEEKNGLITGYTDNYIKVQAPASPAMSNKIIDWQL
jgi:threonylcarbamoyladenosine tRNA methylthiotransferase MtaB